MEIGPMTAVRLTPAVRPAPKLSPREQVRVEYSERAEDEAEFTDPRNFRRGSEDDEEAEVETGEASENELSSGSSEEAPSISFFA